VTVADARLVRLTIVENATQKGISGDTNWAAVRDPDAFVVVEAVTMPKNDAEEWKQIKWSGDKAELVKDKPNRRRFSLATSKTIQCTAEVGPTKASLSVWVLWASIEILTKGMRPAGAAPFDPGTRDGTDKLGAVTYESLSSSILDAAGEEFVQNVGASGKIVAAATLAPKGVNKIVPAGWSIQRQVWSKNWADGSPLDSSNSDWTKDTSNAVHLSLKPDITDKIYDTDAPDLRWGERNSETYNNFRQWVEWNGKRCSENAPWYWQAQWTVHKDPKKQIPLNDLTPGKNMTLPSKPFFAPRPAR
jgi:hypothetical protein